MRTVTSADGAAIAYEQVGAEPLLILVDGAMQYRAFGQGSMQQAGQPSCMACPPAPRWRWRRRSSCMAKSRSLPSTKRRTTPMRRHGRHGGSTRAGWASCWRQIVAVTLWHSSCSWRARPLLRSMPCAGHRSGRCLKPLRLRWPMTTLRSWETRPPCPQRAAQVEIPALVMDGGASFPFVHVTAAALAAAMPQGRQYTLASQTHDVTPTVLAPVLRDFFLAV